MKLWLWKNFVDGKPEYWAFDNPFPVHMDCGDPQTLGEPCGYAIFKESRAGRPDVPEDEVLRRIAEAKDPPQRGGLAEAVKLARGGDAPIPFKRW
jgi:hypothetical protein